ncbi:MAG: peptide chain release factor N(5)-glutamine methyltransferase [Bacteroidales bacterium]|jgi:release factor glutamine methyltransferase|nr:peptide chain release factor N(5)-glutamine methyltransferase [Bacteroidales bacterium]
MGAKLQTVSEISRHIVELLQESWPRHEAGALAAAIILEYTGMGKAAQLAFGDRMPGEAAAEMILEAATRAAAGEPLQYIFGYTEFCGHRLEVGPGVLIPRPETEEMTLMIIRENSGFRGSLTDLCTGSGCIAIALSLAFPGAKTTATDLSAAALETARRNITTLGASVTLLESDLLGNSHISDIPESNIIVSNPPYVTNREKGAMHRNVLEHEPTEALFVPDDNPLLFYSAIAGVAAERLLPGGTLWLEINENLAARTAALLTPAIYRKIGIIRDIRGKERFIKAEKHV